MIILASASPRRRELLERVGLSIEVRPPDVDERERPGESPADYVRRIASAKAEAVHDAGIVIAADTTVTIDGEILAKAGGPEEADAMLQRLSGRTHQVLTAFVVRRGDHRVADVISTDVLFANLDDETRADYVACGEWRGKAGAYAVQGIGAALVLAVRGSITNVIGLPLREVLTAIDVVGGVRPSFTRGDPQ